MSTDVEFVARFAVPIPRAAPAAPTNRPVPPTIVISATKLTRPGAVRALLPVCVTYSSSPFATVSRRHPDWVPFAKLMSCSP